MLPSEFGCCIVNENTHCKAWQRWNTEYVLNKKTVDFACATGELRFLGA